MLNELDLHITNRCNYQCRVCCFDSGVQELSELDTKSIFSILEDAAEIGCRELHITGGEPLLRNDLEEIIFKAKQFEMDVRVQTNGALLSLSRLNSLIQAGLRRIMISVDSTSQPDNDSLRSKGAYDSAIAAIKLCVSKGIKVRVNSVLCQSTIEKFPDLAILCYEIGATQLSGFYFTPIGRGKRNTDLWISPENYYKQVLNIEKQISLLRGTLIPVDMDIIIESGYLPWKQGTILEDFSFTGCGGGCTHTRLNREYLIIRSDGNVYPCIIMIDGNNSLGNIKKTKLQDILLNDSAWNILDRTEAMKLCQECENVSFCEGGCAGYALLQTGSLLNPDPRCLRDKLIPICPIMKYNYKNNRYGGSSMDVLTSD
jgi:radical SAM protein with 4Fe4S-binding SPASM domain